MKPVKLDNIINGKDTIDLDPVNPPRNNLTKVLPSLLAPISNDISNGDFLKLDGPDKGNTLDITKTPTHPRIRSDSTDSLRKDNLLKSEIPKVPGEEGHLPHFDPTLAHTPEVRKSKSLTRKIKQLSAQRIESPLNAPTSDKNSELFTVDKQSKSTRPPSTEPQKEIDNILLRESPINIPSSGSIHASNLNSLPRPNKALNPQHLSAIKLPNHLSANITLEKLTPTSPFTTLVESEDQPALYQHYTLPKSISTTPKPSNSLSSASPSISQHKSKAISSKGNLEFVFVENTVSVNEKSDKASENDKILLDRLNQAKALSRKEEDGATMHKFTLWNKRKSVSANEHDPQIKIPFSKPLEPYPNISREPRLPNEVDILLSSFTEDPSRDSNIDVSFQTNIISENNSFVDRILTTHSEGGESYSDDDFEKLEDCSDNVIQDTNDSFKSNNLSTTSSKSQNLSSKGLANSLRNKVVIAKAINPSEPSPTQITQSSASNPYSIPSASNHSSSIQSLDKKLSFTDTLDVNDETEFSYSSFSKKNLPNDSKFIDPFHSFEAEIPFIEDHVSDCSIEEEEITMLGLARSHSVDKFENESLASVQTLMSRSGPACFSSLELSHDNGKLDSNQLINIDSLDTSSQRVISNPFENDQRRASSTGFESRKKGLNTSEPRIVRSMTSRVKFEKSSDPLDKKDINIQSHKQSQKRGTKVSKYQILRNLKSSSQNKSNEKNLSISLPFQNQSQIPPVQSEELQPNTTLITDQNLSNFSQTSNLSDDSPNLSEMSDTELDFTNPHSTINNKQSLIPENNEVIEESQSTTLANSPLKWKKGEIIGEGTFGKVFKGLNEKTGELLAIKQLSLADGSDSEVIELQKEISVMWELDHENIVRYYGTSKTDRFLFIILEYVTGGSIASMLSQFGAFTESLIKRFSIHILSGIEYLHSKGIIHRDIKGANILVTDTGIAKLADFGCSKRLAGLCTMSLEESMNVLKGSVPWMAPEVIKSASHGLSSDIWSFGATVIEMATGKPPWSDYSDNLAALFKIATSTEPPTIPVHLSEICGEFIHSCVAIIPENRATAHQLLWESRFLKSQVEKALNPDNKKDTNTPVSNSFRKRFSNLKQL